MHYEDPRYEQWLSELTDLQRDKVHEAEGAGWILIAVKKMDGSALLYHPDRNGALRRIPK